MGSSYPPCTRYARSSLRGLHLHKPYSQNCWRKKKEQMPEFEDGRCLGETLASDVETSRQLTGLSGDCHEPNTRSRGNARVPSRDPAILISPVAAFCRQNTAEAGLCR